MINLFNVPNYKIDTDKFKNLLLDDIIREFTNNFCSYVGIKYGCPVNSASSAIFLVAKYISNFFIENNVYKIPTMIPPVVINSLIHAGANIELMDDTSWVGHSYTMLDNSIEIIDSAQEVIHNSCKNMRNDDVIIYSFYPTKPIGSCDGGMICSNNKNIIDYFSIISNNGSVQNQNSWDKEFKFIGWKMYMNSIQAYIANENLKKLDNKKRLLRKIRETYNDAFGYSNGSEHLYRVCVRDRDSFIEYMKQQGITCGIHYKCCHENSIYDTKYTKKYYPISEKISYSLTKIIP